MKHNWQLIIDESFINNKPLESVIESVYQQGRADAIDEIFNTKLSNGMTLKELYDKDAT